jgi:hypothetical protein
LQESGRYLRKEWSEHPGHALIAKARKAGTRAWPSPGRPGGEGGWPWGLLPAAAALLLYLSTLAPSVLPYSYPDMRDPGILQIKAALLAIPDVTGYPTWVILTHLLTHLPFGDEAYRANLASALYAAAAVFVVYLVCHRLTHRIVPSLAGALLFATGKTFWEHAVIAEVYTLHALFVALAVYALLRWRDEREKGDGYLLLAAFLLGLSLSHHLTSGLLLPGAVLFMALVDRSRLLRPRLLAKGAVLFLLGLTPYLFLPLRAAMDPPFSGADPTTLTGFYELVSGAGFKSVMFAFGPAELPGRVSLYAGLLAEQFHPALLFVALAGVWGLLRRDGAALALLGFLYAGWLFYALEYDITDIDPYFIPTYLILALFFAAGANTLLALAKRFPESSANAGPRAARALPAVLAAALLLAPLAGIGQTYAATDRSGQDEGRRIIEAVEETAEPGSVVLQHRSPLLYMQEVENRRGDLTLLSSPFRNLDGTLGGLDLPQEHLEAGKTVYILKPHPEAVRTWEEHDMYRLEPVEDGLLYKVSEAQKPGSRTI